MKKYIPLVALVLCAGLMLAGCNRQQPAPTEPAPTTEEPTAPVVGTVPPTTTETTTQAPDPGITLGATSVDRAYNVPDTDTPMVRISLAVPSGTGLETVDAYYQQWLDDTLYYAELARADLEASLAAGGAAPTAPYEYEAGFSATRNDGVVLSIVQDYYTHTGGAHGGIHYLSDTFAVESQNILMPQDLSTASFEVFWARVEEAVLAIIEAENRGDSLFPNYKEILMDSLAPRDFYLTDTALVFYWQEYAIAPYVAGAQFFEIPYTQLADILDPRWIP